MESDGGMRRVPTSVQPPTSMPPPGPDRPTRPHAKRGTSFRPSAAVQLTLRARNPEPRVQRGAATATRPPSHRDRPTPGHAAGQNVGTALSVPDAPGAPDAVRRAVPRRPTQSRGRGASARSGPCLDATRGARGGRRGDTRRPRRPRRPRRRTHARQPQVQASSLGRPGSGQGWVG